MNTGLLLLLGLGAGALLARRPSTDQNATGRSFDLAIAKPTRLTFASLVRLSEVDAFGRESPATEQRQLDVRLELIPLSAYDITFAPDAVAFTVTPLGPRTVTLGAPLSQSATGSALKLRSVQPLSA